MNAFKLNLISACRALEYSEPSSQLESDTVTAIMQMIYNECCRRAEEKMLKTHKLEGMHYQSLQDMVKECGGDIS